MLVSEAKVGQALRIYPKGLEHIFSDKVATVMRVTKKKTSVAIVTDECTITLGLGPQVRCEVIK